MVVYISADCVTGARNPRKTGFLRTHSHSESASFKSDSVREETIKMYSVLLAQMAHFCENFFFVSRGSIGIIEASYEV
jgi:hypothetical protein